MQHDLSSSWLPVLNTTVLTLDKIASVTVLHPAAGGLRGYGQQQFGNLRSSQRLHKRSVAKF